MRSTSGAARRIAQATRSLTVEAASFVDRHIAYVAGKATGPEVDRLVAEAAALFDPETTEAERHAADGGRYLAIDLDDLAYADPLTGTLRGTVNVHGSLDLADALDLERTVAHVARQLAELGHDSDLDVRRSVALGEIARRCDGVTTLEYGAGEAPNGDQPQPVQRARREVVLFVHLDQAAITGTLNGTGPGIETCTGMTGIDLARLDTPGAPRGVVTVEQVQTWCAAPDTTVTVKPIIDLNQHDAVNGYTPPDRIADHVRAAWPRCVFPYCTRSSRTADLDHSHPYEADGPPGQTSTRNLFPLCRRHHRMKTHREMTTGNTWTYRPTDPSRGEPPNALLWTSPLGQRYLVDHDGTRPWPPPGPDQEPDGA
ncbi:MAG: HNH endonuclease signature motif containing protein [Nocardioides alkalitolerans]